MSTEVDCRTCGGTGKVTLGGCSETVLGRPCKRPVIPLTRPRDIELAEQRAVEYKSLCGYHRGVKSRAWIDREQAAGRWP
jgi:hypothetical protein